MHLTKPRMKSGARMMNRKMMHLTKPRKKSGVRLMNSTKQRMKSGMRKLVLNYEEEESSKIDKGR